MKHILVTEADPTAPMIALFERGWVSVRFDGFLFVVKANINGKEMVRFSETVKGAMVFVKTFTLMLGLL